MEQFPNGGLIAGERHVLVPPGPTVGRAVVTKVDHKRRSITVEAVKPKPKRRKKQR